MKMHLFGSLLALVTVACGGLPGEAGDAVDSTREPITGGPALTAQEAPITSAVKIAWTSAGGTTTCGALKLGSNVFWTAAHCVDNATVGTTVQITNRLDGQFTGTTSYTRTFASIDVHPSYKNFSFVIAHNTVDHYDIARFTLNNFTDNIPGFPTVRTSWKGTDTLTFAGYGCDALDASQNGKKQQGSFNLVDGSQMASIGKTQDYFTHAMVSIGQNPLACGGDSGSPVFELSGGFRTVGIVFNGFNGGLGYTGFVRYSNVRNWIASPAVNQFSLGFRGFIFNQFSGRCISGGSGGLLENFCDGRNQDTDVQSWRLADSGNTSGFYIINGSSGKCLDLNTTASGSSLVERTCNPTSQVNNTQRWRFDTTNDINYRRLVNSQTGRCTVPTNSASDNPTALISSPCVFSEPAWRSQAWVMTR